MRVLKHRSRLSGEVLKSPSMEMFKPSWTWSWVTISGSPCLRIRGWTRWTSKVPANLNYWICDCVSWLKGSPASPVPRCQGLVSSCLFSSFATKGPGNVMLCNPPTMTSQVLVNAIKYADVPWLALSCLPTPLSSPLYAPAGFHRAEWNQNSAPAWENVACSYNPLHHLNWT